MIFFFAYDATNSGASSMKTIIIEGIEYQLTPVAPNPPQWQPKDLNHSERYYYIVSDGSYVSTLNAANTVDRARLSLGNYFHTIEESEEAAKQLRQLLRLRAYAREFAPNYKPDWANRSKLKWFIYWDTKDQEWSCSNNQFMCNTTTVYMPMGVVEELARKLNSGEVVL